MRSLDWLKSHGIDLQTADNMQGFQTLGGGFQTLVGYYNLAWIHVIFLERIESRTWANLCKTKRQQYLFQSQRLLEQAICFFFSPLSNEAIITLLENTGSSVVADSHCMKNVSSQYERVSWLLLKENPNPSLAMKYIERWCKTQRSAKQQREERWPAEVAATTTT